MHLHRVTGSSTGSATSQLTNRLSTVLPIIATEDGAGESIRGGPGGVLGGTHRCCGGGPGGGVVGINRFGL